MMMNAWIDFAKRKPAWALYGGGVAAIGLAMVIEHGIAAGLGAVGVLSIGGAFAAFMGGE